MFSVFKEPVKTKKQNKKETKKQTALKQLKETLNNVVINNTTQTYKNNAYEYNKNEQKLKSKKLKNEKPHAFSKRKYTEKEKSEILKTMKKRPVKEIYESSLIETLNHLNYFINKSYPETIKSKKKNINTLLTEKERNKIHSLILKFCKEKGLVIYGGMAINKYLAKRFNIYEKNSNKYIINLEQLVADYDIFSINAFEDAKELAQIFKKNNLKKIQVKRAKHDNTWKISVNHQPLIDLTIPDSSIPFKLFNGIRYVTIDFIKAGLYKASADPSGGYYRWKKDALRLEKILFEEEKYISKYGKHYTYFSTKSPFQRFVSDFYGPLSKASFKELGNKKWENKKKENAMKQKFNLKEGNEIKVKGKTIKVKNPKLLEILNIPKNGSYVPWGNNKASYKLN